MHLDRESAAQREPRGGVMMGQAAFSSGEGKLEAARQEIAWISESFSATTPTEAVPDVLADDSIIRRPVPKAPLQDLIDAVGHYLSASFASFPRPAASAEQALARMILERGLNSGDVLGLFAASLRSLDTDHQEPPFSPTLCVTRLLAVLVEQQQESATFSALRKAA